MKHSRRQFLTAASASALSLAAPSANAAKATPSSALDEQLLRAGSLPILELTPFKSPIIIETIELLRKGKEHFVRVRSKDGAEGISVDDGRMNVLHPILNHLVIPYFIGKDARDLEEHL